MNNTILVAIIILGILLILILIFSILAFVSSGKKSDESRYIAELLSNLEKNIIKDSHEGFIKIMNQSQHNSDTFTKYYRAKYK